MFLVDYRTYIFFRLEQKDHILHNICWGKKICVFCFTKVYAWTKGQHWLQLWFGGILGSNSWSRPTASLVYTVGLDNQVWAYRTIQLIAIHKPRQQVPLHSLNLNNIVSVLTVATCAVSCLSRWNWARSQCQPIFVTSLNLDRRVKR